MSFRSTARRGAAAAAATLGVVAGLATAPTADAAGEFEIPSLTIGLPFAAPTLDEGAANGQNAYAVFVTHNALEPLLSISDSGELEPWLAEDWEQTSDTVYEYHLRQGVNFWNGDEMQADDVVASWEHFRRPESAHRIFWQSVDTIEAVDDYTVRVTLTQPDPNWKYMPSNPSAVVFEREFFEAHEDTFGQPGTLTMGTGPWVIDSLNPTTGAELSANPDYWGGDVNIGHISIRFFSDETSMALAMRAEEIDVVTYLTDAPAFEATSGVSVTSVPTCENWALTLPVEVPPWDDVHVRRAVAYAMDRQGLTAVSGFPAAAPAYFLIPRDPLLNLGVDEAAVDEVLAALPTYEFDIEAAQAELAQSAYPDGFETELLSYPLSSAVDQAVAAQLEAIGITVRINAVTAAESVAISYGPAQERQLRTSWLSCDPDPSGFDTYLSSATLDTGNLSGYTNPELDELLEAGLTETDGATRLGIYGQILDHVSENLPYVPLFNAAWTGAWSPDLEWPTFGRKMYYRPSALEIELA